MILASKLVGNIHRVVGLRHAELGGNLKQYDPKYLEDMSAGDEEFVRDILSTFLETAGDLVAALTKAGETSNAEKAIYAAHTLKGSSRSVGAVPLGDLCEALEKLARAGDMDGFREQARVTPDTFALLRQELGVVLSPKAA